jgi:shikimate kinase
MGSGKSILGKLLASRLSLHLIDLDDLIVERAGKSIPDIFQDEGELAFRALESEMLVQALQSAHDMVVATGGGAILSPENRVLMQTHGKVVWLDAPAEVLANRITGDANRPLLNDVDPLEKMKVLTQQRNPLYAELADLRVDTHVLSDQEAVDTIAAFLSE